MYRCISQITVAIYWNVYCLSVGCQCFRQKSPWPLSLLAFRAASHTLALPRRAMSSADPLLDYISQKVQTDGSKFAKSENNVKSCDGDSSSVTDCIFNKAQCDGNTMPACRQSDDNADSTMKVSPVQQVSVSWGDADSELSAGIMICLLS